MIKFSKVDEVAKGDRVTSTQIASLAEAFNQRIRSGLGDPVFRIWFYLFAMFRQVRNCDEDGLMWPAHAEYFEYFQAIRPQSGITWPTAEAGMLEGANLASIMNAFVFGADAVDLESETVRMSAIDLSHDGTAVGLWEMAKRQRGAIDPTTGIYGAPAMDAAREMYRVMTAPSSGHGNSFGGYVPSPYTNGWCEGVDANGDPVNVSPRQEIFFTNIHTGEKVQFTGNCAETEGDLAGVIYSPLYYVLYVWHYKGSWQAKLERVLDKKDWTEGPYKGVGVLRKLWGNHIPRVISAFLKDFRGTEAQREDMDKLLDEAADWQAFFTRQYHLAPQRGHRVGSEVAADYPTFRLDGFLWAKKGQVLSHSGASDGSHVFLSDFVCTGALVKATGLQSGGSLDVMSQGKVVWSIPLAPDADGNVRQIVTPPADLVKLGRVHVVVGSEFYLVQGGSVVVELNELVAYKPEIHDAYAVIRMATCNDLADGMEGSGVDEGKSRMAMEAYFESTGIVNVNGGYGPAVPTTPNVNPVWDAARRLSLYARVINRLQFVGYEVQDGRSILYFKRYALGHSEMDSFRGIAPSDKGVASGAIKAGLLYKVTKGKIRYGGAEYGAVSVFTGVWEVTEFEQVGQEAAVVMEAEGIRHVAPPQGWTNEWVLDMSVKAYHPSESSMWKPSLYGDFWPWLNRCHLLPYVGSDSVMSHESPSGGRGLNLGGPMRWVIPEGPSGYTYADGMNFDAGGATQLAFFKSCRVYEPPVEIDSVSMTEEGFVRVELKGRLHHCELAPAHISRDIGAWNVEALRAEPYRTNENGLREYLVHMARGAANYNASVKVGDGAANGTAQSLPDNPYGCVYPHFFLCQLVPKPWADANETRDSKDTACTVDVFTQMELYLRAMCEGAIDGETSAAIGCDDSGAHAYDFTWTNFCLRAFGEQSMGLLPGALRPDAPEGFGPLPNTIMYASTFNRFARGINMIHRYRVPVKYMAEIRSREGYGAKLGTIGFSQDQGAGIICFGEEPAMPTLGDWTEWAESGVAQAIAISSLEDLYGNMLTHGQECEWRISLSDPRVYAAFPPAWRDMVDSGGLKVWAKRDHGSGSAKAVAVSDRAEAADCGLNKPQFWWESTSGTGYKFSDHLMRHDFGCDAIALKGRISHIRPGDGDHYLGINESGTCSGGPYAQTSYVFSSSDAVILDVEVS